MIFKKSVFFLLVFLVSAFKSFSIENDVVTVKDSTGESKRQGISFCNDSVFSFRSKKGFVPSLIHNFGEQAAAPFKMNAKQAWMVAGGVVITGALFFADENMDKFFKPLKTENEWINKSSPQITELGSTYGIGFIGVFGGYGLLFKDKKAFRTALLAAQAAITSGVWVRIGKILTARERPSASYNDFQHDFWWGPFQQFNSSVSKNRGVAYFDAFPSGHTATAFSIASVFAHQYADKPVVPVISYSLATLAGVSRLTEHAHWASDVFAGACIGYLCGKQVVKHAKDLEAASSYASKGKIKSDYFFSLSGNQLMLNCRMTF